MQRNISWEIYKNVEKLMKYRNINPNGNFLSENDFNKNFIHNEFITIEGTNTFDMPNRINKFSYILLISPNSNYGLKSQDFKALMKNKISTNFSTKLTEGIDLLIITENQLSTHIEKVLTNIRTENPNSFIENYPYFKFAIEIPKHISVPKHEYATEQEINDIIINSYKMKNNLPKINSSDSAIIWLGARIGDIIKITRFSENAGYSIAYR